MRIGDYIYNLAERFRFCCQFEIKGGKLTSFRVFLCYGFLCCAKSSAKAATTTCEKVVDSWHFRGYPLRTVGTSI